jgi:general secretion pathway protein K
MGSLLRNRRGVALILTILIVSLIVALTVQFNRTMRTHVVSAGNIGHGLKALYAAKSGVACGLAVLQEDDSPDVDTLQDDWADPDKLASKVAELQASFGGGGFTLEIFDESGKIPINQLVDSDYLEGVFRRLLELEDFDLDKDTVDTIVNSTMDWIDENDLVSGPYESGAEDDYYLSLEPPYHCKNGPLDVPEELLLVKGMTPEIFYGTDDRPGIGKFISVFGDGKININTAEPEVLASLHELMTLEMGKDMKEYRKDAGNELSLSNPTWYQDVPSIGGDIILPKDIIGTSSNYFEIRSKGHFGNITKTVVAMAKRDPDTGNFPILSWEIE